MSLNIKNSAKPDGLEKIAGLNAYDVRKFTKLEWDNLSQAEIDKIPDGTEIIITDDGVSTVCPTIADCLESDNADDVAGKDAIVELNNNLTNFINNISVTKTTAYTNSTSSVGVIVGSFTLSAGRYIFLTNGCCSKFGSHSDELKAISPINDGYVVYNNIVTVPTTTTFNFKTPTSQALTWELYQVVAIKI